MPRRLAVLADVHGNLAALRAVLDDLGRAGVEEIVVAGDMVSFGADSDRVVDLLRERGAGMIRGNHEQDYVAPYDTPSMPHEWKHRQSFAPLRWTMEQLGPARRAYLAGLPDRLRLDELTLVIHGSPRFNRDAVTARTSEEELAAMYAGEVARVAFSGHSHRPVVRDVSDRRLVNVGSVGLSLDGDPRAAYALVEAGASGAPGDWRVELRRVAYDVEEAIAAYGAFRELCPEIVELLARELRTARDYFGPMVRSTRELPDHEFRRAVRRFLDAHS